MSHLIPLFKINLGTYTKGKPFQIATVFMHLHLYYEQMLLLDTLNHAAKLPYELINWMRQSTISLKFPIEIDFPIFVGVEISVYHRTCN